jgi:hypothetical protein
VSKVLPKYSWSRFDDIIPSTHSVLRLGFQYLKQQERFKNPERRRLSWSAKRLPGSVLKIRPSWSSDMNVNLERT